MKYKTMLLAVACFLLIMLAHKASIAPVYAQSGGSYFESARLAYNPGIPSTVPAANSFDLTWNTIDGGGGTSEAGAYSLSGTVGQPDAGTMGGGSYTLSAGFWVNLLGNNVMLPFVVR